MTRMTFGITISLFSASALAIAPSPVAGGFGLATLAAGAMLASIAGVRYIKSNKKQDD